MPPAVDLWERDRSVALNELVDAAMPEEGLTEDELLACIWEDPAPTVALGIGDSEGAVAAVLSPDGHSASIKLLAVRPDVRRRGYGQHLLAAVEIWARDRGASALSVGASAPFYLWPGVDFRNTPAICLFESAGYRQSGAEFNMACPTSFRASPPDGVTVTRVLEDDDAAAVVAFASGVFPNWVAELERGIETGGAFVARDRSTPSASVVGFACHSVNRVGWIGPMGTDRASRHRGVGASLLAALCKDLYATGVIEAEVAWVGPAGFYANTAGASVSRVFRRLTKQLE